MTASDAKKVAEIRKHLASLKLSQDGSEGHWRATAIIPEIVNEFLRTARLRWKDDPAQPYDGTPEYASQEHELVSLNFLASPGKLHRRGVSRSDGRPLDRVQRLLLLEFQSALLTVLGSLRNNPDRLADFVAQGLIDQAVAGVVASVTGRELGSISLIFHQRLLGALRELLLSTYEGAHATVSIVIVPQRLDGKFAWTQRVQDGLPFLRRTKIARTLSDGEEAVFVFSAAGDFYGLFQRVKVDEIIRSVRGTAQWEIRHAQTLSLKLDGIRRFELFCGQWRIIDDAAAYRSLVVAARSFDGSNEILWRLALKLSDRRHGGLILVVKDIDGFLKSKCCKTGELNLPGAASRLDALASQHEVSGDERVIGLNLPEPKEILLEQFRGMSARKFGLDILFRLASVDGAVIALTTGRVCGFGVILSVEGDPSIAPTEGARTRAALLSSKFGVAIKISEDGPISIYSGARQVFP
jgi:hypothetical protein